MPSLKVSVPGEYPQPYRFALARRCIRIGRSPDSDIPVPSESVSLRHAEIHRIVGGYEIRDCGSTNGIRSNGETLTSGLLASGAALQLGEVLLDFTISAEELGELAGELATEPPSGEAPAAAETSVGLIVLGALVLLVLAGVALFAALALRSQGG
jgi:pSer/pThr/pTyr-binding forkhead associated (FHA) protein